MLEFIEIFNKSRFINECARKKKLESRIFTVSHFFFRCTRTHILNNIKIKIVFRNFAIFTRNTSFI